MKTIIPSYYKEFKCIADKCTHNCCLEGWEIDIDDQHAAFYKEYANEGKELSDLVSKGVFLPTVKQRREGMRPHINLYADGGCPFLDTDGLCRLIKTCGEQAICQICTDHPRFRNFYDDHIEMGVGLCCEEAGRLLLESEYPFTYKYDPNTNESIDLPYMAEAVKEVERGCEISLDFSCLKAYLLSLDCIEPSWKEMIAAIGDTVNERQDRFPEEWYARIREYLIYRHYMTSGAGFVSISLQLIESLYINKKVLPELKDKKRIIEILRLYSSEIEYSEEAPAILQKLLNESN